MVDPAHPSTPSKRQLRMPIGTQRFTPRRGPIATFRCPAPGAAVYPVVKTKWQSQLMACGQL